MAKRTENIRFPPDPQLGRPYSRQGNNSNNIMKLILKMSSETLLRIPF
jgi:hypothetical protein